MKIIVDAFGGDNAPLAIIEGCLQAVEEFDVDIVLTGEVNVLKNLFEENKWSLNRISFENALSVIKMDDEASTILRTKKDSSMAVGLNLLANGDGDAFVSAGNTGAVLAGASLIVKRIKGIKRAALAPLIPTDKGVAMLIDCGANIDNKPEFLKQFAIMGFVYMQKVIKIENPRVGLLNNGIEETKGMPLQIEAYGLLKNTPINFIGNVEGRDIPMGAADVVVADGFTGNVLLKTIEGMGLVFISNLKGMFMKNILTKFAAMIMKNELRAFKKKMDYSEYGGAPLMGISKPVIKAHGSANAKNFKNSIRQAIIFCETGVISEIEKYMEVKTEE